MIVQGSMAAVCISALLVGNGIAISQTRTPAILVWQ